MLRAAAFIQLVIWVATTHAFFPWIQAHTCLKGQPCQHSRDVLDGRSQRVTSDIVTYKLTQRVPDVNGDPSAQAAREASRLLRKYGNRKPSRTTRREPDLTRRDNDYSLVSPEPTSEKSNVGIYQDGTDFCYFVEAGLGSEGKPLYMLLDTGAGTTWVMGSDCSSSPCKIHNSFGPSDSKTYEESSKSFSIEYGSGTVRGNLAKDTISLAGLDVSMTFGIASVTSDDFSHFPFDGILGLSRTTGSTDNFLQVVKDDKSLKSSVFGVSLSRNSDGPNTGEVSFGGANPSKYTGEISYSPLSSKAGKDWAIIMDSLSYDGKDAGVEGRLAYIDTGTSYVFGPEDDVAALHELIPGAKSSDGVTYTVPCKSDLPITVSFSGKSYTISSKDWLSTHSDGCTSNIYGHAVVPGAWLLGDLFLKNVYTVFDADEERIGFAAKPALSSKPTATTATAEGSKASAPSGPAPTSDGTMEAPSSTPSGSSLPGLSGHETSVTADEPAAQRTGASATSTKKSPAEQLERNKYVSIIGVVAVVAMVA